jgi:hypothetical protein
MTYPNNRNRSIGKSHSTSDRAFSQSNLETNNANYWDAWFFTYNRLVNRLQHK